VEFEPPFPPVWALAKLAAAARTAMARRFNFMVVAGNVTSCRPLNASQGRPWRKQQLKRELAALVGTRPSAADRCAARRNSQMTLRGASLLQLDFNVETLS